MILGVIADDFTGATDVASMLVRAGMRTVLVMGVPTGPLPDAEAIVVALKSRTAPVDEAVADSVAALHCLQAAGARQFYFKYCSTFDSTPDGNIGPVAEALLNALGSGFTVACPALPENGRTVYRGHLFVGDQLLSDSGMRHHPLTPMTDANLVRVLQAQCHGKVGLAGHEAVSEGVQGLQQRLRALQAEGMRFAIVDAVDTAALHVLAQACADLPLVTAGSGLALGLPAVYQAKGWLQPDQHAARLTLRGGPAAVLSGSCSQATQAQVADWLQAGRPGFQVDVRSLAAGEPHAQHILQWVDAQGDTPVLVYATAHPAEVQSIQAELGVLRAGQLVEDCLSRVAVGLKDRGVRRLVVAGGETSGAVVQALGVQTLRIGPTIDPGVPWTQAEGRELLLALKSGNFGGTGFFAKALALTD